MSRILLPVILFIAWFTTLQAQDFRFSSASLNLIAFNGVGTSGEVEIVSDDPAFDPRSLTFEPSQNVGHELSPLGNRLRIHLFPAYLHLLQLSGQTGGGITVKSATHSRTISASATVYNLPQTERVAFCSVLNRDATRLYLLRGDRLSVLNAQTSELLLTRALDAAFAGEPNSRRRTIYLSDDETEVRMFSPGRQLLLRHDAKTLLPRTHLFLDSPTGDAALAARRTLFADRDGLLYFVRTKYDPAYNQWSSVNPESVIEVRDSATGTVRQSLSLPHPAPGPPGLYYHEIRELALHPQRAEAWALIVYGGNYSPTRNLVRIPLLPDGTLGEPLTPSIVLASMPQADPWNIDPLNVFESYDTRIGFGFSTDKKLATIAGTLFDDSGADPVPLRKLPYQLRFSPKGDVGFARDGRAYDIDTGSALALRLNDSRGYSTVLRFDSAGAQVLAEASSPRLIDLAEYSWGAAGGQTRVPAAGAFVSPPSELSWQKIPGADAYRVYLSEDPAALGVPAPDAEWLLGESSEPNFTLAAPLHAGRVYYWRVDIAAGDLALRGEVQSFTVSHARIAGPAATGDTVQGSHHGEILVPLLTSSPDTTWQITSATPWLEVVTGTGAGPGYARISVDASALPAGEIDGLLQLTTADGTVPLPLRITAHKLNVQNVRIAPGQTLAYARSTVIQGGAIIRSFLLAIDTGSERIARSVDLGDDYLGSLAPTREGRPLYGLHRERIAEYDPITLAELRSMPLPDTTSETGFTSLPSNLTPTSDGRFWLTFGNQGAGLFDPSTSSFSPVVRHQTQSAYLIDAAASQAFARTSGVTYGSFTRVTLDASTPVEALNATRPLSPLLEAYYAPGPVSSTAPFRFAADGLVMDSDLVVLTDLEDDIVRIAADASVVFGRRLVYSGNNYNEVRSIPETISLLGYAPLSRKLIRNPASGSETLRFTRLDDLPLAPVLSVSTISVLDTSLTAEAAMPAGGYRLVLAHRRSGSGEAWQYQSAYAASSSFTLNALSPKTDYEFKVRAFDRDGETITPWSPIHTITTAVARPLVSGPNWNAATYTAALNGEFSLALNAQGEELAWTVLGLPPGLSYDSESGLVSGEPTAPGRYLVTFTAANGGGQITVTHNIWVPDPKTAESFARYSGLIDLDAGPLSGAWTITRTGAALTGTYRSTLFSRSFKTTLSTYTSEYLHQGAAAQISYQGVPIHLRVAWDKVSDRMNLSVATYDLVENFRGESMEDTGLAAHWRADVRPYPHAKRFTGLLLPGENDASPAPEGSGFFTATFNTDARLILSGETALGKKFTQTTYAANDGSLPLFWYSRPFLLLGSMQALQDEEFAAPLLAGALVWAKDSQPKGTSYRAGFIQEIFVFGTPLPATGKKLPPLDPLANAADRVDLRLSGGDLARLSKPITQSLVPGPSGFTAPKAGSPGNPNRVSVKLASKSGIVTGSAAIRNPAGTKTLKTLSFRGMLVKDPLGDGEDLIGGYFLLKDAQGLTQSGALEITEPTP